MSRISKYLHSHHINKTYKINEKVSNASQTCQDDSGLFKVLLTEDKKNENVNSTEDLYNYENKRNNIASHI